PQTLLQQFHDILPGSSITWVHRRCGGSGRTWSRARPPTCRPRWPTATSG
ncbi:hypothetical protein DOU07_08490, partial [Clavibacter michiganensis subsp. michiganensis]|nr:hypothetical protein [Clavibacter michiganensis subsp. michiganensis]